MRSVCWMHTKRRTSTLTWPIPRKTGARIRLVSLLTRLWRNRAAPYTEHSATDAAFGQVVWQMMNMPRYRHVLSPIWNGGVLPR